MNIAFYNGVSGLVAYQQEMDLVSNNVANVNTVGYKPSRASFSDLLYTQMWTNTCLLYTSPSPRDRQKSRMPSSA